TRRADRRGPGAADLAPLPHLHLPLVPDRVAVQVQRQVLPGLGATLLRLPRPRRRGAGRRGRAGGRGVPGLAPAGAAPAGPQAGAGPCTAPPAPYPPRPPDLPPPLTASRPLTRLPPGLAASRPLTRRLAHPLTFAPPGGLVGGTVCRGRRARE